MKNYSWTLPLEVLYQDGIISLIQLNGFQFCGVRYLSDLRAEKHVIRNSYLKEEAVYLCSLINAVHIADNPNEDRKIFINSIPSHLKQIAEYSFRAINERIKSSVESSPIFDSSLLLLYNLFRQGKNLLDSFSDSEQRYVLIYFIDVLRNYSCCFKDCIYFSYYISNVLFKVSISFEDLLKARNIFYEEVKDSNPIKPHQVSNSIDNEFDKLVSNLSVRAQNVLRYNQIGSIEDFCSWVKDNDGKFMSLRSCGRKTAMELENLNKEIISNNLSVQRTTSVINSVEIANDDISESYFTFLIGKFQTWNNDKVKSWIVENFYTAENFFKELNYSAANVFSILYPKHTKNVFGELLSITEFITSAILCQESKNVSSRFKLQLFDFAKLILNNKDYLLESYLLTYHKKILLYEEFQKRLRELNVRSRNGLLKVVNPNSIDDIIKFINEDCDFMSIGHVGKKSSIGLNSFYNSLHQYFYGVLFSNEDDVKQDIVIKLFPFLSTQEVAFVYNFKVRYGYFPMFYVCKAFFEKSIRQKVNIYRGFYGIGLERPFDYDELTERYNITRERVRQLVSRPEDWIKDQNESLFDEGKWNNYKFIKLDILTEEKSEVTTQHPLPENVRSQR